MANPAADQAPREPDPGADIPPTPLPPDGAPGDGALPPDAEGDPEAQNDLA